MSRYCCLTTSAGRSMRSDAVTRIESDMTPIRYTTNQIAALVSLFGAHCARMTPSRTSWVRRGCSPLLLLGSEHGACEPSVMWKAERAFGVWIVLVSYVSLVGCSVVTSTATYGAGYGARKTVLENKTPKAQTEKSCQTWECWDGY